MHLFTYSMLLGLWFCCYFFVLEGILTWFFGVGWHDLIVKRAKYRYYRKHGTSTSGAIIAEHRPVNGARRSFKIDIQFTPQGGNDPIVLRRKVVASFQAKSLQIIYLPDQPYNAMVIPCDIATHDELTGILFVALLCEVPLGIAGGYAWQHWGFWPLLIPGMIWFLYLMASIIKGSIGYTIIVGTVVEYQPRYVEHALKREPLLEYRDPLSHEVVRRYLRARIAYRLRVGEKVRIRIINGPAPETITAQFYRSSLLLLFMLVTTIALALLVMHFLLPSLVISFTALYTYTLYSTKTYEKKIRVKAARKATIPHETVPKNVEQHGPYRSPDALIQGDRWVEVEQS